MPPYVAQRAGYTESMIPIQATPSTVQQTTGVTLGKLTSGMWPVWIVDSVEDNDEEAWETYLQLESRYQELSRKLAASE
jgi:hypothetical protein